MSLFIKFKHLFSRLNIDSLLRNKKNLKDELCSVKSSLTKTKNAYEEKVKEISVLKKNVQDMQQYIVSVEKNASEAMRQAQKHADECQELQAKIKELEKDKKQLQHSVEEKDILLSNEDKQRDELRSVKSSLMEMKNAYEEKVKEISVLKKNVQDMQQHAVSVEKNASEAMRQAQKHTDEYQKLQAKVKELEKDKKQLQHSVEEKDKKIENLSQDLQTKHTIYLDLLKESAHKNEEFKNLTTKYHELQDMYEMLISTSTDISPFTETEENKHDENITQQKNLKDEDTQAASILKSQPRENVIQIKAEEPEIEKEKLGTEICEKRKQETNCKNDLSDLIKKARTTLDTLTEKRSAEKENTEDITNFLEKNIRISQEIYDDTESSLETNEDAFRNLSSVLEHIEEEIKLREKEKKHLVKRRITEVFDAETGDYIQAYQFFARPESEVIKWRRIFEQSILLNERRFLCPNCRQMVKISGRKFRRGTVSFFSHLHDSDFCEIKTTTGLTREQIEARKYGLVAESERHRHLKALISQFLSSKTSQEKGVINVEVEKRINGYIPGLNWRRPDVVAQYKGMNLVFELQLSTTFISVVVQRDIFYRLNKHYIIWVFNFDENEKYVDLTNLMCKDIYYGNKRNIFVFDREAQKESEKRGELVLKCNWLDSDSTWHYKNGHEPGNMGKFVTLDELHYDEKIFKPYYYDADTPYYERHPEVKARILHEEEEYQKRLDQLNNQCERDKVIAEQQEEEMRAKRDIALKSMVENNESAIPYKEGTKYGLAYKGVVLVPPRFSSCQWVEEYGMFQVSYKRKIGLYDKFANEVFPCEYLDFHKLDNGMVVAESVNGFYVQGVGMICSRSPHDTISLKSLSPEVSAIVLNSQFHQAFVISNELLFKKNEQGNYAFYYFGVDEWSDETYSEYHFTDSYQAVWLKNADTGLWKIANVDGTDRNGKRYAKCHFEKEMTIASQKGQTDLYSLDVTLIHSTDYDDIEKFGDGYWKVLKENMFGLLDESFHIVVPTHYLEIVKLNAFILVQGENNLWGIYDKAGEAVSAIAFDRITQFTWWHDSFWCNYLSVYKGGRQGLYNDKGCVIEARYTSIELCDGYIEVKQDEKYGLFDAQGHEILPCDYIRIASLIKGKYLKCQSQNGSWHLYSFLDGNLSDISYDELSSSGNEYIVAKFMGKALLMDAHGKTCIPPIYENIEYWHDNVFKVCLNQKWGLYVIPEGLMTNIKYDNISRYNEDKTSVSISVNGATRTGHIDSLTGKETYSAIKEFTDGMVAKLFFGKWGLFNAGSKVVIPLEYEDIDFIGHHLYKVKMNGKTGVKNVNNQYVLQPDFRDVESDDDTPYLIGKLIKYKRQREYTYGRSYHMVNVEYNEYQLFGLDGTQKGIPSEFCGTFSSMKLGNKSFIWLDNRILLLDNFRLSDKPYISCKTFERDGFWMVTNSNVKPEKYGLLNANLKEILPCLYNSITSWGNGLILTLRISSTDSYYSWNNVRHEEYALYKPNGSLCPVGNLSLLPKITENGKAQVITTSGKVGYIDLNGDIITDSIKELTGGLIVHRNFLGMEVLDRDSKILITLSEKLTNIEPLIHGVYKVQTLDKYGLFSVEKGIYVPCQYESIDLWTDEILISCKWTIYGKRYVLISIDGIAVNPTEYSRIDALENERSIAYRNGYTGLLNEKGQEISDIQEPLLDNLSKIRIFGLWGVVNEDGREILPCQYTDIRVFEEDKLLATNGTVKHLFNLQGESYLDFNFSDIRKEGRNFFVIVMNNGICVLLNSNYEVIVQFSESYYSIEVWGENLFIAGKRHYYPSSTYYVLLNGQGEVVTPRQYVHIDQLQDGRAEAVDVNGKKGFLDVYGHELIEKTWNVTDTIIAYWKFSKYELRNGNEVLLSNVDNIIPCGNGLLKIKLAPQHYRLYDLNSKTYIGNRTYQEIGSFKGQFIAFYDYTFDILNQKCVERIPVQGIFARKNVSTLVYKVGWHYVKIYTKFLNLNEITLSQYINQHKTLDIIINSINKQKQISGRPYQEPFKMGQSVSGTIYRIHPYGIRIRTSDNRLTFIHISRLTELGYELGNFEIGQPLALVKVGYDEKYKKDLWNIVVESE